MANTGRLRARGSLKLAQFWPDGKSDADTANLTISLDLKPAFVYRPSKGTERATKAFNDAHYDDNGTLKPILGKNSDKLRVRLQGIDAPELHYLPRAKGARNFRQCLAESAVFALRKMLLDMAAGEKELRADAITFVGAPNETFDRYGRFVGNVTVYADGFAVDINHWLLEHGWAVPGLYNSMTRTELTVARTLSAAAAAQNIGLYKSNYYKEKLIGFEWDLIERHGVDADSFTLYDDKGDVMNPKFFRRQALFETREKSNPTGTTFADWLKGKSDFKAILWPAFSDLLDRKNKAKEPIKRKDLTALAVKLGGLIKPDGSIPKADDIINVEEEGTITTATGKPIKKW